MGGYGNIVPMPSRFLQKQGGELAGASWVGAVVVSVDVSCFQVWKYLYIILVHLLLKNTENTVFLISVTNSKSKYYTTL